MIRFRRSAVLSLAFGVLVSGATAVSAEDLVRRTPVVHLAQQGAVTQAQIARRLVAEGYSGVLMSEVPATPSNPHPETNPTLTAHPETQPVRHGWNGVAEKDGQTVQVYVDD
ncbi:MAG: hypothetical protein F8N37_21775 [Telmatospirillum sp.]|nr:hypothetical protein [Telmatospirillum sp.]